MHRDYVTTAVLLLVGVLTLRTASGQSDDLQRNARLALIKAKQNEDVCGLTRCNLFVAQVGELRGIPYIRDVLYPEKPANAVGGADEWRGANSMYTFIDKAVQNPDQTGWRRIDADQAQQLANQGRFVLGVKNAQGHGHIAMVVPEDMQKSSTLADGQGPWIRDAQHPQESVRASRGGNTDRWGLKGVLWAVWDFEDQNRLGFDERQGKIVVEPRPSSAPPRRLTDADSSSAPKRASTLSHAELSRLQSLDEDHRKQFLPPPAGSSPAFNPSSLSPQEKEGYLRNQATVAGETLGSRSGQGSTPALGNLLLQGPGNGPMPQRIDQNPRGGVAADVRISPQDFQAR